jgi:hypothetical protein
MTKWNVVFKRLMTLMDQPGEGYFSGSRFIRIVQQFNEDLLNYNQYIQECGRQGKSTTRRDFYSDVLIELDEGTRVRAISAILDELQLVDGNAVAVSEIRTLLGGGTIAPSATPPEAWSSNRLNEQLAQIDGAIASGDYERAVTLSYSSLEGFYGAFIRAKEKRDSYPREIIALSKEVKGLHEKGD